MVFKYPVRWPPPATESAAYVGIIQVAKLLAEKHGITFKAGTGATRYVWNAGKTERNVISVTSTKRSGWSDYHDYGLAVDFASTMDKAGRDLMKKWANIWYAESSYLLEEIHSVKDDLGGGARLVRNGQRYVQPGPYGWGVVNEHEDHVHVAMSTAATQDLKKKHSSSSATVEVQPGDTLSRIARMKSTTVEKLQALNNLGKSTLIKVGQKLRFK
jgi:LysM repeat protein